MALQYPLLFPYGEDGFNPKIAYVQNRGRIRTKRSYVTMREYYAHVSQYGRLEGLILIYSGRLFQQCVVDAYTCIEQAQLKWILEHQGDLRTKL
jgi:hypothetical protein